MARAYGLAALITVLVPGIVALGAVASAGEDGAPPGKNGRPPIKDAVGVHFAGTVTEVTKTSITVKETGEEPTVFAVSDTLASGEWTMQPRRIPGREGGYPVLEHFTYRLTDVKKGDWVDIIYSHLGGVSACEHIDIYKRPGGRVPPLSAEAEALRNPELIWKASHPGRKAPADLNKTLGYFPYHEEMNAYWDLVDKGIPYPEKFGEHRRFPIAPMPHTAVWSDGRKSMARRSLAIPPAPKN